MAAPLLVGVLISAAGVTPAGAQNGDPALGLRTWKNKANCKDCHGWAAHGTPDDPQSPSGATLRATTLTPEGMAEVIQCGRPDTPMPYFHRSGWTDRFPCYGMVAADAGDMVPEQGRPSLNQREVDGLVAYIFQDFVGKPPPTFEECKAFWGETASRCVQYPHAEAP